MSGGAQAFAVVRVGFVHRKAPERLTSRPGLVAGQRFQGLGHAAALFTPRAELEGQRHEGLDGHRLAFTLAPRTHEVGDAAVAAGVALRLDLRVQRARCAPLMSRAVRVDLERLLDRVVERGELARRIAAPISRLLQHRRLQPLSRPCKSPPARMNACAAG